MPTLDRITIYPIKSLDGIDVAQARVLACGALEHDRLWRLVDLEGVAIFLEVTAGDAGGLIQRSDIGGAAIVDACFGAAENFELIQV